MHFACFVKILIIILSKMNVACFETIQHVYPSNIDAYAGVEFKFLKLKCMLHVLLKHLLLFYLKCILHVLNLYNVYILPIQIHMLE